MKARLMKLACVCLAFLAVTIVVNAQSPIARVHVPFPFVAAGTSLPAGDYLIDGRPESGVLLIRGSAGKSVLLLTIAAAPPMRGSQDVRLTFERRGSQMFLAGIQAPDEPVRQVLPVPGL